MSRRNRSRRRGAEATGDPRDPREGDLVRWVATYLAERAEAYLRTAPGDRCAACEDHAGRAASRRDASRVARWFHGRSHDRGAHWPRGWEHAEGAHRWHAAHGHGRHAAPEGARSDAVGGRPGVGVPWPLLLRLAGLALLALGARARARGRTHGRRGFSV